MNKTHTLENVSYEYQGGNKWQFKSPKYCFIMRINAAKADKAASIINGAIKRKGEVDGMARHHLNKLETDFNYVPSRKKSNGVLAGFLRQ